MRACAIVPQKPLAAAKSRLAGVLRAGARHALSAAMLGTVCASLRAAPGVEDVILMTPDPDVRAFAAARGLRSAADSRADLNEALVELIRSLAIRSRAVLIIAADLPLLSPADVAAMLAAATPNTAVLAPARDGTGTNALLVPPAAAVRPAFGPASLHRHRAMIHALGLRAVEVHRPGLAFDLDSPADLLALGWPSPRDRGPSMGGAHRAAWTAAVRHNSANMVHNGLVRPSRT